MHATPDQAVALVDGWTDDEFRANLSKVFKRLIRFRETNADELADAMHIARSTFYGKLASGKFSAVEVHAAARALRVKVDAFYLPADSLLSDSISRWYIDSTVLTSPDTAVHNPFQLPLDFAAEERREDIKRRTRELLTT